MTFKSIRVSFTGDRGVHCSVKTWNILSTCLVLITVSGCVFRETEPDPGVLHDRLINLLITGNLPLGDDNSRLRGETIELGNWIRNQLIRNPEQRFRLAEKPPGIRSLSSDLRFFLSPECHVRIRRLQDFFIRNHAIPRSVFSVSNLEEAFLSPASSTAIRKILELSRANNLSETGGIVTIRPVPPAAFWTVIPSDNERLYLRLAGHTDSPSDAARILKKQIGDLPFLKVRAARTIDLIESAELPDDRKRFLQEFLNLFKSLSKYSYILNQGSQYAVLAEQDVPGLYLGLFHVHPENNPPSPEDRMQSFLKPNVVIVPGDTGYLIHYLDYRAGPNPQPVIFRSHRTGL